MNEEWRKIPIAGVPDYYEVSNFGRLRSLPYIDKRGWRRKLLYMRYKNAEITLRMESGRSKWFPVAALVLRAFVGPPAPGQRLARHLDDNRDNNKVENLAWGTDADNIADAMRNGETFITRGHLGKKHSPETIEKLRERFAGKPTGRKITEAHRAALRAGYEKHLRNRW